MSYILEALRKSERERSLGKVPTLNAATQVAKPRSYVGWWLALLLAICIFSGWWLWYGRMGAAGPVAASPMTGVPAPTAATRNQTVASDSAEVVEPGQHGSAIVLNVISWSADPQRRFAMINQKIVREGEALSPGVTVKSIEADRVIISRQGQEMVLTP